MTRLETLQKNLLTVFGDEASLALSHNELTLEVPTDSWIETCTALRDHPDLGFEICIDLCGIDYSGWRAPTFEYDPTLFPHRFAVVIHLLSVKHNWRLRVRTFVAGDDFPVLPTLFNVWPTVNWFEREAFDLFGIVFEGHLIYVVF